MYHKMETKADRKNEYYPEWDAKMLLPRVTRGGSQLTTHLQRSYRHCKICLVVSLPAVPMHSPVARAL